MILFIVINNKGKFRNKLTIFKDFLDNYIEIDLELCFIW